MKIKVEISSNYLKPKTFSAQSITMNLKSADTWYETNLAGTYTFVEMYRNYPVYKVSTKKVLSRKSASFCPYIKKSHV